MFGASHPSHGLEVPGPPMDLDLNAGKHAGLEPPTGRVDVWRAATALPHSIPLGCVCVLHLFLDSLTSVLNSDPEPILSGDSEFQSSVDVGACIVSLLVLMDRAQVKREGW